MASPLSKNPLMRSPSSAQQSDDGLHLVPDPTLEVVDESHIQYDTGKEVVVVSPVTGGEATTPATSTVAPSSTTFLTMKPLPTIDDEGKIHVPDNNQDQRPWYKRPVILAGIIVAAVVIILAAVLGGYFGTASQRNSDKSGESTGATTTASTPTQTAADTGPTGIAPNSPITVAAWENDDDYSLYIAYRSNDKKMRESRSVRTGSTGAFEWKTSEVMSPEYPMNDNAAMAMAVSVDQSNDANAQIQLGLLYLNSSSYVNGLNYVTGGAAQSKGFQNMDYNNNSIKVQPNSNLAYYWPFFLYQAASDGGLKAIWYEADNTSKPYDMPVEAGDRSKLAVVPVSRNVTKISGSGYWAIFYQDKNGNIAASADPAHWAESREAELTSLIDTWGSTFPSIKLADNNTFTAFSVARSATGTKVNTFLLYQDSDTSDIKQAYTDDDSGWSVSSPESLKGADKGTDIACVTTPVWKTSRSMQSLELQPASDLSKCYFQKGGKLMEVLLNGKDWEAATEVSFPT